MGGDEAGSLGELVERLHAELAATEELPVERGASRWIGEAQGVVSGVADGTVEDAVVRERVEHVVDLLGNVETTGSDEADEHVESARELAVTITERSSTDDGR
jgi:hypothetical protein